jgi:hypothetical protein
VPVGLKVIAFLPGNKYTIQTLKNTTSDSKRKEVSAFLSVKHFKELLAFLPRFPWIFSTCCLYGFVHFLDAVKALQRLHV